MNVDRGQKSRATPGSPNRDIQPIAFISELGPIRKILELAANRSNRR